MSMIKRKHKIYQRIDFQNTRRLLKRSKTENDFLRFMNKKKAMKSDESRNLK